MNNIYNKLIVTIQQPIRRFAATALIGFVILALAQTSALAASGTKTDTATMNLAGDWSAGVLGAADTGTFNSTISAANAAALSLGGNVNAGALVFTNTLLGDVTIASGNTLTLNLPTSINMSLANSNVTINSAVALATASQTWNVNTNRVLTVGGGVWGGAFGLTKSGAGKLNLYGVNGFSTLIASRGTVVITNATTLAGLLTAGNAVNSPASLTITNGTLTSAGGSIGSAGTGSWVNVVNGTWNPGGSGMTIANGTNGMTVGQGGVVTNSGYFAVNGPASYLIITNGGRYYVTALTGYSDYLGGNNCWIYVGGANATLDFGGYKLNFGQGGNNNYMIVDRGGVVTNIGVYIACNTSGGSSDNYNYMVITNGGQVFSTGDGTIAGTTGGANYGNHNTNWVYVGGSPGPGTNATWNLGNNQLLISSSASKGNYMMVDGGGIVKNVTALTIGNTSGAWGNYMVITNGGQVYATSVTVGNVASVNTNWVSLTSGGLLEAGSAITVGNVSSVGNTVTNSGGILQFTAGAPTITKNNSAGGNQIVFTNSTLAYRGIQTGTLPNLTNNWVGATTVAAFTWQGDSNTFRLDNTLANNTLGRPYVFSSALGPTNYARLEMINGLTAVSGAGGVTIDGNGSLLISNAEARIVGPFTNFSANVVLANAVLEANKLNNQGAVALTNFSNGRISGGFQFTTNMPSITAGTGIALNNGVLSYRNITNANVRANQVGASGGNDSVNITLLGNTGFELNYATNSAATDQTYIFSAGLGTTNFAGLAMVNGTTRYRNGSVTIAPDGWLLISNTVAIFDNTVTNLGNARMVNSTVTYTGAYVTTNGAVNEVLNSTVNYLGGYVNLGADGTTNWYINSTLNALGYTVRANDLLGFGATNVWGVDTNSSAGFQVNAGGAMWVSNNAYTVFTVPLTNAGAVQVSANAVLETKAISNTGTITNNSGYLLFATNYPAITTGVDGIVVTNGGIGYGGGIANADVRANQVGQAGANDTTNITFQGPTVFMLNKGALNTMAASQSYTFDPGLGATTNFAGLVLGGSSVYRTLGGDTVTFTNNASMLMLNSTATYTIGNGISNVTYNVFGTNGGGTVWNNGARPLTIGSGSATGNVLNVAGGQVNNAGALTIGNSAGSIGNSVTLTGTGTVYSASGTIGNAAGASSNTVTVTDSGSLWGNSGALVIGNAAGATGNVLNVVNTGLVTCATLDLKGFQGQLNITNAGKFYGTGFTTVNGENLSAFIGNGASSNTVTVSGAGSVWTNSYGLRIGLSSTTISNVLNVMNSGVAYFKSIQLRACSGQLNIANAGKFYIYGGAGTCYIFSDPNNNSNTVTVTGDGSLLNLGGYALTMQSKCNAMNVLNGGVVTNVAALTVGLTAGEIGNSITISGGGKVYSTGAATIGAAGAANSHAVTVTGASSLWTNSSTLVIGSAAGATGNVMNVWNTGLVTCTTLDLKGFQGRLNITNAGRLNSSGAATIGGVVNANSNTGMVTDTGSVWDLRNNNLTIGVAGATNNALTVANNGVVTNVNLLTIGATNSLNLFGGFVFATSLTNGAGARIGFDRTKPGSLKVAGNAYFKGTLDLAAFNLPGGVKETYNFLTYGTNLAGSITLGGAGATPSSGQFITLTTNTVTKTLVLTMWRPGGTLILIM